MIITCFLAPVVGARGGGWLLVVAAAARLATSWLVVVPLAPLGVIYYLGDHNIGLIWSRFGLLWVSQMTRPKRAKETRRDQNETQTRPSLRPERDQKRLIRDPNETYLRLAS
jgi:hypothetical protein